MTLFTAIVGMVLIAATMTARAESLQMGVSVDVVPVGSDFDGTDIVVFGSIEGADDVSLKLGQYQVVVTVLGAEEDTIVRQKERIFGIWINRKSRRYTDIPSFYSTISRLPLEKIAEKATLRENGIGAQNLSMNLASQGTITSILPAPQFVEALRRIRHEEGLYSDNPTNLKQLSPTLFRAGVYLPPNVPIGRHQVVAHLFKNGELLTQSKSSFRIQKVGFERWMYDFAHQNGLLYGIMAVFIAIATGWTANALFRKR